ncbi:hypothetical protein GCM10027085_51950 [Spirosoma aerophilum]
MVAQTPSASLTGQAIDARTGKPLPFASIYLNNSTRGTTADENGLYRLTNLPLGTHQLVGSVLGYATTHQTLKLGEARPYQLDLKLEPSGKDLSAITVTARRSGPWQRQFRTFSRELLGNRPPARFTTITNPGVLQFTEQNGHLQAVASEPLLIDNLALGYRLHYTLLYFDFYRGRMNFAGDCRFEALTPASARQGASWQANRLKAYRGSLRHLLASLLMGTQGQEGFTVYRSPLVTDGGGNQALPLIRLAEREPIGAQQALALFRPGELPFERRLVSAQPLEVYYNRIYARNSPYQDSPYAYSMLLLPQQGFEMTTDGWITQGQGLDARGYLGQDRLATLLPADWVPTDRRALTPTEILAGRPLRPGGRIDSLQSGLQRQLSRMPPLVFIHTDKSLYSTGDPVWFSAYVLDPARQLPLTVSSQPSLQVDLIDPRGRPVDHQWLPFAEGRAGGRFQLSDSLTSGTYRLRAYTDTDPLASGLGFERMLTVYNSRLPLNHGSAVAPLAGPMTTDSLDVQLLPEGGRWLVGVAGRLGVKVVQPNGRGQAVEGHIVDENGQAVGSFTTNALGMGQVTLTPVMGKHYTARVATRPGNREQVVALPAAEPEGWALGADALSDSARLLVRVRATGRYQNQPVFVTLQNQGQLVYNQAWQLSRGEARFGLPTGNLRPGVFRLTLWDSTGRARAERLVFIPERTGAVQMRVLMGKARYAPREPVAISLQFRDPENYPVVATWSAAVTDADQLPADTIGADLRTWLLLTGGLRGPIESPAHYLVPENAGDLDNLLLTQGWRRLPAAEEPVDTTGGWQLSGRVLNSRGRPLTGEVVSLLLEYRGVKLVRRLTTDAQGAFRLTGLLLTDTIQVRASTPRVNGSIIRFDSPGKPFATPLLAPPDWSALARWTQEAVIRQAEWPALYRDSTARQLAEVLVRATRLRESERSPDVVGASLHQEADNTLVVEGNSSALSAPNMGELLKMVPGIYQLKRGPIHGNPTPLYILDGVYTDAETVGELDPRQVSRIELLKNVGTAAIYGARSANGVIAIFTRKGGSDLVGGLSGAVTLVRGLAPPSQYYTPRYELPEQAAHTDRRDVLFWQPLGQSDQDGQARLNFPLSDQARRLRLVVQGLTSEGVPIHYTFELPLR